MLDSVLVRANPGESRIRLRVDWVNNRLERGHTQAMGELAKRADAHVSMRIRERRTSMGLTQQDVADALKLKRKLAIV